MENLECPVVFDSPFYEYQKKRRDHWDKIAEKKGKSKRIGAFYQQLLQKYFKLFIPPGLRVLELGCGHGDLLNATTPSEGIGIDFSQNMIDRSKERYPHLTFVHSDVFEYEVDGKFDIIILSDLINDVWDVQALFTKLYELSHSKTRLILNFYNNLWRLPLSIVKFLGLGADVLTQNWFSPHDVKNLLELSGFEIIKQNKEILLPVRTPLFSDLFNQFIVRFFPFNHFALANMVVARKKSYDISDRFDGEVELPSVSVIIAARNEAGNIESILKRIPDMGRHTEIIFVEGHSQDNTYQVIEEKIKAFPQRDCKLFRQTGAGKGDAVRLGFQNASGDILMILDADMTVPPETLPRFYNAIASGTGEFINGVRLVYPMEEKAMRFFNIWGNKFFSLAFSWLLGQPVKDTLCGTKVLWRKDYELLARNRSYFGDFDPFGDFDLLFGAAKLNFKICEMPIRYRERLYGDTNIDRWKHGWMLLKMVVFAARRIKFV